MTNGPISEGAKTSNEGCGILICLGFCVIGLAILSYGGVVVSRWYRMQSWVQTPCTILTAGMHKSRSDGKTQYRADFTYEYEFGGVSYQGDRDAIYETSGAYQRAEQTLKASPVGTETICWVDSDQPAEATLSREFPAFVVILVGVFGSVFTAIGGGAAVALIRSKYAKANWHARQGTVGSSPSTLLQPSTPIDRSGDLIAVSMPTASQSRDDQEDVAADQPQRLRVTLSKWGQLIGAIFVCLFWNGIVSVFVYQLFTQDMGWFALFLGLFLIPFVLVGLLLIAAVFHTAVGLFNPNVSIALSTGAVARGGSVDVAWEVGSGLRKIGRLRIAIVGNEWAQYQQGTDTRTDESVFEVIPVVDTTEVREVAFGTRTISIPATAMHTMHQTNNRIQWTVRVRGEIKWWPDVHYDYKFRVKPVLASSSVEQ